MTSPVWVVLSRAQVDPSVGCRGRHKENRLLADHLDMVVVQSFGEFSHRLRPLRVPADHDRHEALPDLIGAHRTCRSQSGEQLRPISRPLIDTLPI